MTRSRTSSRPFLSIVTPAFNESKNLPVLYDRIQKTMEKQKLAWEWVVVDDHSADDTYGVLEKLGRKDERVRAVRFARNAGSHLALSCGFHNARGQAAVCLAADLQDPPEFIGQLVKKWRQGAKVVWAVRAKREGESLSTLFFARLYYFIVRHVVGLKQVPPTGADFFLADRSVLDRLVRAKVNHVSLLLLISSFDVKQDELFYDKAKRLHGRSGWTLRKKIKLVLDTLTMFSWAPIWWTQGIGLVFLATGWVFFSRASEGSPRYLFAAMILLGAIFLKAGVSWWRKLKEDENKAGYSIEKRTFR